MKNQREERNKKKAKEGERRQGRGWRNKRVLIIVSARRQGDETDRRAARRDSRLQQLGRGHSNRLNTNPSASPPAPPRHNPKPPPPPVF
eukprot:3948306-Pleurochrysis_carterae.AAC.1